jgi:hypothetical protein
MLLGSRVGAGGGTAKRTDGRGRAGSSCTVIRIGSAGERTGGVLSVKLSNKSLSAPLLVGRRDTVAIAFVNTRI